MTINQARKLFNEFVLTWNDSTQKCMDIFFDDYMGDLPDVLLPAEKTKLIEAFQFLTDNDKRGKVSTATYSEAIKLLNRFVPTKKITVESNEEEEWNT